MRPRALLIAAATLACSACGLFLDDLSKGGNVEDAGTDTSSDSDTGTETPATPCDGVDLAVEECCNLEDTCMYGFFPGVCECPTCPWDSTDCVDAGTDSGTDL